MRNNTFYDNDKVDYKEMALNFYKSEEWRKLRYRALKYYGNKCSCCGKGPEDGVVIDVDHIVPLSLNWNKRLDIGNLQILCKTCNLGKGNVDSVNWREGNYMPICKTVSCISSVPKTKRGKNRYPYTDDSFIRSWVNNFWLGLDKAETMTKEQAINLVKYILQQQKE